jgi:DnaJ-class molecular chaperone
MGLFNRKETEDAVVDLREPATALQFGYPTPCPECGGAGYLDNIDITRRVMFQHCTSCFTKYQVTEEELISAD